jgi:hypothetical protein
MKPKEIIPTEHINYKDYRKMKGQKIPSKMRNIKTEVDGMIFDSQKEANYYCELKIQKQQRDIIDFFLQVPFLLQEGYWKGNEWIKPVWYKADFLVIKFYDISPVKIKVIREIHEVKGRWSDTAKIKRKMFEKRYPEYEMVVI